MKMKKEYVNSMVTQTVALTLLKLLPVECFIDNFFYVHFDTRVSQIN